MAGNQVDIIIRAVDKGVKKAFSHLAADVKRSKTALDVFNKSMKRVNKTSSIMSNRMKAVFGGVGIGVVTRQLWDAGVAMQRLDLAFAAIAGSSAGGVRELEYVRSESDRLGISFREAAEGYKSIYAAGKAGGMEMEQTRLVFKGLAEASMALGLNNEQVTGSYRAIGQMMGKQKVLAEEIRTQLGEKMPTAIADFAEAAGVSVGQFEVMMAKGEVGMSTLVKTMELWSSRYGKKAEEAAAMAIGALGRWRTAWFDLKVVLANSGFLEEATKNLTLMAKALKDPEVQKSIKVWAGRFFDLAGAIVDTVWEYKTLILALGGTVLVVRAVAKLVTVFKALSLAFTVMMATGIAGWLTTFTVLLRYLAVQAVQTTPVLGLMAKALGAFGVGFTIGTILNKFDVVKQAGVTFAHGMTKIWIKLKTAWANLFDKDAVAELERQLEVAETTYTKMMDDLRGVAKQGKDTYKDIADAAEETAEKEKKARTNATAAMEREYKKYVKEIKKLQDELAGKEQSLQDELRTMAQSGMSDLGAWKDRRKEAKEFYKIAAEAAREAEKAASSGAHEKAIELAKKSQDYYEKAKDKAKSLNEEVKAGEKVIISKQKALKIAYAEAKKYGESEIAMQEKLIQYNQAIADSINEKSGFAFVKKEIKDITIATDKYATITVLGIGKAYTLVWKNAAKEGRAAIKQVDDETSRYLAKHRTLHIDVKVNTTELDRFNAMQNQYSGGYFVKKLGGLVGSATRMAFGGLYKAANAAAGYHFAGYGGGDRPSNMVMAEDGEVMLRKESVRKAGLRAALAFNSGNWAVLLEELMRRFNPAGLLQRQMGGIIGSIPAVSPVQMMAAGGAVGSRDLVDVNFNLPGGSRPVRGAYTRFELMELTRQIKQYERDSS